MKRIQSACLLQTIKFESKEEFEAYLHQLTRKGIKHKLVETKELDGGFVEISIKKQYNSYSVGSYLD